MSGHEGILEGGWGLGSDETQNDEVGSGPPGSEP